MFLVYATQSARLLIMLIIWQNRKVCVLCNLKPASMRGIKSQAMVLAASNSDHTKVSKLISTFSFVFASFVHLSEVIFPSVKSSNLTNGYVIWAMAPMTKKQPLNLIAEMFFNCWSNFTYAGDMVGRIGWSTPIRCCWRESYISRVWRWTWWCPKP